MAEWSLTTLQLEPIKIAACAARRTRAIAFQLAEAVVKGAMVKAVLAAIRRIRCQCHVHDLGTGRYRPKAAGRVCASCRQTCQRRLRSIWLPPLSAAGGI